ncbi:MAG: DUF3343 domain-containing protein [Eubacteriales bacterium]|jgi:hypothetical protein
MNKNCIFVLSSVTYVMKAERLLANAGIYSTPVKTGEVTRVRGCGYGLAINSGSNPTLCERARAIIEQNGIRILGQTEGRGI